MTKILVVDDEQGIVDLLVDELSSVGFDVISANNGAMALVLIYNERPDIVLLDLMLPVANGYQVIRELRGNPSTKDLPVVLLTAISSEEVRQTAAQLGSTYYMTKPWKLAQVLEVIRSALDAREGVLTQPILPVAAT